jgi:hypothetical protein
VKPPVPAVALLLLVLAACASAPGTRSSYRVESVEELGPLLAARLAWSEPRLGTLAGLSSDARLSLLFPAEAACQRVLEPGAVVAFAPSGFEGTATREGDACRSVGIFDLPEWRDRLPQARTQSPVPRRQASFRLLRELGEFALVRGRFPLTGLVGFAAGYDSLALLPTQGSCRALAQGGVASIEFRSGGPDALALVGDDERCAVYGLARPDPALGDLSWHAPR